MAREVLPDLNDTLRALFPEVDEREVQVASGTTRSDGARQANFEETIRR